MSSREEAGAGNRWRRRLATRLRTRQAVVAVVGLGYVGLPLLYHVHTAGFKVLGIDHDESRIRALRQGRSYVSDVPDGALNRLASARLSSEYLPLTESDVIIVCVPTPLRDHEPDLSMVRAAAEQLSTILRPGMLVILESTTYPGTTEEVFLPILEISGLCAGRDFALAYSPERTDPGRGLEHVKTTPKVVGGLTRECTRLATELYRSLVEQVHTVSSLRQAEMAKLIENTFRHVNIALANELALASRELGVDIWEAIGAAATKPFGFMPFWPGPGVGGHCIAVDPSYLSWRVGQQMGHRLHFIEYAQQINARMPAYVVQRVSEALNCSGKALMRAQLLCIGASYKADVGDCRESPALEVIRLLIAAGASVSYHDPHVPTIRVGDRELQSSALSPTRLSRQDCVLVLTAHTVIDFEKVAERAALVFDARGVSRGLSNQNVVRL